MLQAEAPDSLKKKSVERARVSLGKSERAIYQMVASALDGFGYSPGTIVDVGCGDGALYPYIGRRFERYIGVDCIRYDSLPLQIEMIEAELNSVAIPLPDAVADVVVAVEVIEHLENPRAFIRELVRIAAHGGCILVTTPNQLSILSLLCLLFKNRFGFFQDVHYPAHLTALLEVDLLRMAGENSLQDVSIQFSRSGRIPLTSFHYPFFLPRLFPRLLSDNIVMIGRRP